MSQVRWSVVVCAALALVACTKPSRDLQPGSYRATLDVPGGELPFGLDVAKEEAGFVLYLINGEERVRITDVKAETGRLSARMPGYEHTLSASIIGGDLRGDVTFVRPGGVRIAVPFRAELGKTWRFYEQPLHDNADVSGRWAVNYTDDAGKQSQGVGEFTQKFGEVNGTVLTATGDQRFLSGEIRGDELFLSRFDGGSAFLYRGKLDAQGHLQGDFWSGKWAHKKFTAVRNDDAVVDGSAVATAMKDPEQRLDFAFKDLDGKLVSSNDPRFRHKVLIIALSGSWCPNCHDEAAFLAPFYREYRDKGVEVLALMFEHHGDFAQAAAAVRGFRREFGIEYPTLIAGISDTDQASTALPQLTGIYAFPTTIFVDRNGSVRKVHAGFAGPATGLHYEQFKVDFMRTVDELLSEAAADAGDAAGNGAVPAAAAPAP